MKRVEYSIDAIESIQEIGIHVRNLHGAEAADKAKKKITSRIRSLKESEYQGTPVIGLFGLQTEYRRLYIAPNNIFYKIEGNAIKIVDVIHEKEDYLYKLFGIQSVSEESDRYWDDVEWEQTNKNE